MSESWNQDTEPLPALIRSHRRPPAPWRATLRRHLGAVGAGAMVAAGVAALGLAVLTPTRSTAATPVVDAWNTTKLDSARIGCAAADSGIRGRALQDIRDASYVLGVAPSPTACPKPSTSPTSSPSPTAGPSPAPTTPAPSPSSPPPTTPTPSPSSPAPSPTASPSPTPGPLLDCLRQVGRCGYPTAATTGPRSPIVLTAYTGPLPLVIPAGQTMSGLIVPGCVRLQTGASLVDSIVRPTAATLCGGYAAVDQEWSNIQRDVALRHVEVDLSHAGANRMNIRAITGSGFELDHVHCWGGADCVHYGAYVTIHDSYLHTPPCLTVQSAAVCFSYHIDALHSASSPVAGALVHVEHNTIVAEENTATNYATSAWINGPAIPPYTGFPQSNVHGVNNLLAGGGWVVYCEANAEQASSVPMAEFRGNRISDLYYPRGGYWGATTDCKNNVPIYSDNVYDRTGLPL